MEELNSSNRLHSEIADKEDKMKFKPFNNGWPVVRTFRRLASPMVDNHIKIALMPIIYRRKAAAKSDWSNREKAPWNDSQEQFMLHLLQCFPRAQRGGWSEDTWKLVAQAINKNFPNSNFTIGQLMKHEQCLIRRQHLESSGGLSGSCTKISPYYAEPVAVYKGPHLEAVVETKSATTQIGTRADAAHNAQGITNSLCSCLSPPKEGSMNNLNSCSTIPQSVMSGNLQVQSVNCHSFKPSSPNSPPFGVSCVNNCEKKSIANNDSDIGRNHSLSAQLIPDPASNYQQPPYKHDSFYRNKHKRKFSGKPNGKKLRAANSDFSTKRCIKVFKKLPGFKEYHMDHVLEIFSDELYREAFISMKKSHKVFWLRSKLDKKE